MKLLITTATAALLGAGTAFAGGAMADIDTDASGGVTLEEAQAYDPSVTADAFGEFDADSDATLNETEFAAWEDAMGSADGQGDASIDSDYDAGVDLDTDADAGVTVNTDPADAELGADVDTDLGDVDADADAGLELGAE